MIFDRLGHYSTPFAAFWARAVRQVMFDVSQTLDAYLYPMTDSRMVFSRVSRDWDGPYIPIPVGPTKDGLVGLFDELARLDAIHPWASKARITGVGEEGPDVMDPLWLPGDGPPRDGLYFYDRMMARVPAPHPGPFFRLDPLAPPIWLRAHWPRVSFVRA